MKALIVLATVFLLAVRGPCAPGEYATFTSPSAKIVAKVGIAGPETSSSVRLRLRIVFESEQKAIGEVWTGFAKHWAATWSEDDIFLVCGINEEKDGEPFEVCVYDFIGKERNSYRAPTDLERARALAEYRRKYPADGKKPNKALEPTITSVTIHADAWLAPAALVAHL